MSLILLILYIACLSIIFYILKILGKNVDYKIIYGLYRIGDRIKFLERISKSFFARLYEILSIPVGFIAMIAAIYFIIYGIKTRIPAVVPVIPGMSIYGIHFPFLEVIIAIFISALVHELAHGLLILKNGIQIKSYGIFFLGPFLGAFVEPSEEVYKINKLKQIAIFHAGIFANIILALLALFAGNLFHLYLANSGNINVIILGKVPNTNAINITGEKVLYIGGYPIKSLSDIQKALQHFKPGETITLITNVSSYRIKLSERNGRPFMGYYFKETIDNKFFDFLLNLLFWIMIISLGIGLGNALPIFILDGGYSIRALFELILKDKKLANVLYTIVSYLMIFLIIFNFVIIS